MVFSSSRAGNTDLYVIAAVGGTAVRLTDHPAGDDLPAWSPDGRRLAFVSERSGRPEIWLKIIAC
ncbi:MAG: hypothetical protein GF355_03385 [Candidatus Eisenbacteria bacterium]|nr:hypothetical protein [Candidatus Eisenbacteria bacterium]